MRRPLVAETPATGRVNLSRFQDLEKMADGEWFAAGNGCLERTIQVAHEGVGDAQTKSIRGEDS